MSLVILSEAKDLKLRILRSFAVFAAQDDGGTRCRCRTSRTDRSAVLLLRPATYSVIRFVSEPAAGASSFFSNSPRSCRARARRMLRSASIRERS